MCLVLKLTLFIVFLTCQVNLGASDSRVLYAVNAGGSSHVDSNGINFLADPISIGTESDYGTRLPIKRVNNDDQILYQTERWHDRSFHYTIPVHDDGDFVLVLKFAEVYFYGPNMKIFDVRLNDQHLVVKDLDIFDKVGNSVAHDEVIPFTIKKGKLSVNGEYSTISNQLKVEFVKGGKDNPKVCAFYLMKGKSEDVYQLPAIVANPETNTKAQKPPTDNDYDIDDDDTDEFERTNTEPNTPTSKEGTVRLNRKDVKSGRPADDPYKDNHTSLILPIVISLSIFIPTVLFMCRL